MNRYIVLILALFLFSCSGKPKEVVAENEYYVCSMDPQVMEKQSGACPICKMPLSKVTIDRTQMNLLKLNDDQIKLANVKTVEIMMDSIGNDKTLTGVFAIDQELQQQISSRFNGRIEKLYFKIAGQLIKEGDLIYEVYSRDLMLAEEEYLFAIKALSSGHLNQDREGLVIPAKNKLLLWGLTELQIKELETDKVAKIINPIYSKNSGTILEIPYKEGDYINEGSTLFKLADLSSLWVEAQVYSNELNLLDHADKLLVIPDAFPEEQVDGEIEFSNPELQSGSKINLIRVKIPNKRKLFVPGMMAYVVLKDKQRKAITLPPGAVLQSGEISLVWIKNKDGSFEAREVRIGIQTKAKVEIISGLSEHEIVVVSGSYLLNSEYVFKRGSQPMPGMKM